MSLRYIASFFYVCWYRFVDIAFAYIDPSPSFAQGSSWRSRHPIAYRSFAPSLSSKRTPNATGAGPLSPAAQNGEVQPSNVKRSILDLEVVSESALVVLIGGAGAVAWMALSFVGLMIVNIANVVLRVKRPGGGSGITLVLYSACLLATTTYNTILFQTKQAISSSPDAMPLLITGILAATGIMILSKKFASFVCSISIVAVVIYLLGVVDMLSSAGFFADAISTIINDMWNVKAAFCGYLGACAIGSYVINVKSASTLSYNKGISALKLVFYSASEYICTVVLCVITGIAIVGSGSYKLLYGTSEYIAANTMVSQLGSCGSCLPTTFAVLIVVMETYYVHKHWGGLLTHNLNMSQINKAMRFAVLSVPLVATLFVMLIGSRILDIDIMPFVHVSDKITGMTVLLPLCTWALERNNTKKYPKYTKPN